MRYALRSKGPRLNEAKGSSKKYPNIHPSPPATEGPATLQVLTPAEDLAASVLPPEMIGGFAGHEAGGVPGNAISFQFHLCLGYLGGGKTW